MTKLELNYLVTGVSAELDRSKLTCTLYLITAGLHLRVLHLSFRFRVSQPWVSQKPPLCSTGLNLRSTDTGGEHAGEEAGSRRRLRLSPARLLRCRWMKFNYCMLHMESPSDSLKQYAACMANTENDKDSLNVHAEKQTPKSISLSVCSALVLTVWSKSMFRGKKLDHSYGC